MNKSIKIYLKSFLISLLLIGLPWILAAVNIISFIDVLQVFSIASAIMAILVSFSYIIKSVSSWKERITLFILNPAPYYIIFLVYMYNLLSQTKWIGWDKLLP